MHNARALNVNAGQQELLSMLVRARIAQAEGWAANNAALIRSYRANLGTDPRNAERLANTERMWSANIDHIAELNRLLEVMR